MNSTGIHHSFHLSETEIVFTKYKRVVVLAGRDNKARLKLLPGEYSFFVWNTKCLFCFYDLII